MVGKRKTRRRADSRSSEPKGKSLIEQNQPFLFVVILVNIVAGIYLSGGWGVFLNIINFTAIFQTIDLNNSTIRKFLVEVLPLLTSTVLSVVIAGIMTFANGLLSAPLKNTIVFWDWSNPMPSDRAFTEYAPVIRQIDYAALKRKYGKREKLPRVPEEQTKLWFRIYDRFRDEVQILHFNRGFLLMRDWCGLSIVFLLAGIMFVFWSLQTVLYYYVGALIAQYVLTMMAARNYAKQLVIEVLVIASHRSRK